MEELEQKYNSIINDFMTAYYYNEHIAQIIKELCSKALAYDMLKLKQSQGGRKARQKETPEERRSRCIKASHARPSYKAKISKIEK